MTASMIYVSRETDLITDDQVRAVVVACNSQVKNHIAPAYGLVPKPVRVLGKGQPVLSGDQVIRLVKATDEADALGYHTELKGDIVCGYVGVGTVLDAGSKVLTGELSVATVVSHEICEMLVDPLCSSWADSGKGWLVATEVCDPVQSTYYSINNVTVSDFVLPDFFSPVVTKGDKFDYLGVLKGPFKIAKGGYVLNYEAGQINTYFGEEPPPEWVMKMKTSSPSRTSRLRGHRPAESSVADTFLAYKRSKQGK